MKEVRLYIGVDEIDIGHISEKYNGSIYTIFKFITDNPDDVSDADRITLYEVYNGEINDPRSEFSEEEYDIYDEEHEVENEVEYFKDDVYGDGEFDDKWDLCWKESERKEFEEEVAKILKKCCKESKEDK